MTVSGPAEACTCAAITEEAAFASAAVVADGVVELSMKGDALQAKLTISSARKGARPGEVLEVRWVRPDGFSCSTVDLLPGEWTLYLQRLENGELWVVRCDQYSRRKRTLPGATLAKELALHIALDAAQGQVEPASWRSPQAPRLVLKASDAQVRSLGPQGWFFRWFADPPGGWAYEVQIEVSHDGRTRVKRAEATHSSK